MNRPISRLVSLLLAVSILILALSFGVSGAPTGAPPPDGPAIRLHTGAFVPTRGEAPALPAAMAAITEGVGGRGEYLVQFGGPVLAEWRAALAAEAEILDYVPDYAYRIRAEANAPGRLRRLPGVIWVGPYLAGYRISRDVPATGRQVLRVELEGPGGTPAEFAARLPALGARMLSAEGDTIVVEIDGADLAGLSAAPGVRWIAPLRMPTIHNDASMGEIAAAPAWNAGFAGEGQSITIADTGIDTGVDYPGVMDIHRDINDRKIAIRSWPIAPMWHGLLTNPLADDGAADVDSGHGTHVTGSAVGDSWRSGGQYRGVAYRAGWAFQALEQYCTFSAAGYTNGYYLAGIPADLRSLYAEAYGWGTRVHTNSWGYTDNLGAYSVASQQTDHYVWDNRDMVILFATGNRGTDANGDGRTDYGSITPPATAKNVIAVGATENRRPTLNPSPPYQTYGQLLPSRFGAQPIAGDSMTDAGVSGMMAFSGRGPTTDGRIAPHVVAPGTWVASLRSSLASQTSWGNHINAYYTYMGGTSMSTPQVAGAVALVRQAYLSRGHAPSAALVKATIIQSARDVPGQYPAPHNDAGPIPNNDEGWGALNVAAAVAPGRRFVDENYALQTGQEMVYTYTATASVQAARFTLVWTDYPAAVNAAVALVNDLDLEVTAPDGRVYRGNVFSAGWSATGGNADRRNNVEAVYLPTSQAGTYRVRVRAHNTPQGPQNYALLVSLPLAQSAHRMALPLAMRQHVPLAPGEFRDMFDVNTGVWPVASESLYATGYTQGEYFIRVHKDWRQQYALPGISQSGDLALEVDVRPTNTTSQAYGIVFNHRLEGGQTRYHSLIISPTGYWTVIRENETPAPGVSGWTHSTAIATGIRTNRLSLRRVGQTVECRINSTLVATLSAAELAGGSRFGLVALSYAEPQTEARYDYFRMVPLSGAGIGAITAAPAANEMPPVHIEERVDSGVGPPPES